MINLLREVVKNKKLDKIKRDNKSSLIAAAFSIPLVILVLVMGLNYKSLLSGNFIPEVDYTFIILVFAVLWMLNNSRKIKFDFLNYREKRVKQIKKVSFAETKDDNYIIVNLKGKLYFDSAGDIYKLFSNIFREHKTIIIRMKNVKCIDATVMKELTNFIERAADNNGDVIFCGVKNNIYKSFKAYGIVDKIGSDNIFKDEVQKKDYIKEAG